MVADLLNLAALLGLGFLLFHGGAALVMAWRLTHPPRRTYATAVAKSRPGDPAEAGLSFDTWRCSAAGRDFEVWDIRGEGGPTVVMVHGWGDSRLGALVRASALAPAAGRVVAFDLPGHGESGAISRLGTSEHEVVDAVLDSIEEQVVLYGWSLGAGVALRVASERPCLGVVAEAPYRLAPTPARNVMRVTGMPWRLQTSPVFAALGTWFGVGPTWRGFDRAEIARRCPCPLLVLHGTADRICPIEDGRAIGASGRLVEIEGAGHNDLWTDESHRTASAEAVRSFLESIRSEGGASF